MTKFGLIAAGPAFLIAYIIHFVLLNILTHTLQGFRWRPLSLLLLARFSPQAAVISSFCLPLARSHLGKDGRRTAQTPTAASSGSALPVPWHEGRGGHKLPLLQLFVEPALQRFLLSRLALQLPQPPAHRPCADQPKAGGQGLSTPVRSSCFHRFYSELLSWRAQNTTPLASLQRPSAVFSISMADADTSILNCS